MESPRVLAVLFEISKCISRKNRPQVTNTLLDFRLQRKPAESIERCVLLDPEQGYIEALRIVESRKNIRGFCQPPDKGLIF